MALCEGQLQGSLVLPEESEPVSPLSSPEKQPAGTPNNGQATPLFGGTLAVDYRSPRSHFMPPEIDLPRRTLASRADTGSSTSIDTLDSSVSSGVPAKRKRGRPRVDKTSPEYLARVAARKQAREQAAATALNSSGEGVEKRKRGRPRIDKTTPEYLARKRAREQEALEKKQRQHKRRTTGAKLTTGHKVVPGRVATGKVAPGKMVSGKVAPKRAGRVGRPAAQAPVRSTRARTRPLKVVKAARKNAAPARGKVARHPAKRDSGASSSMGEARVKRKYTRRAPALGPAAGQGAAPGEEAPRKRGRKKKLILGADGRPVLPTGAEKPRGKRGRRRKSELAAAAAAATANATGTLAGAAPAMGASFRQRHRFHSEQALIINSEPIPVDSDEEPNLGSPGAGSDSLSLDENLRALRHLHEKYANLNRDDDYSAHLLAARFRQRAAERAPKPHDGMLPAERTERTERTERPLPQAPARTEPHVEKLEDSSDSDSSSSGSGSSSSGSSSSGSSSSGSGSSSEDEASGAEDADGSAKLNGRTERLSRSLSPPLRQPVTSWTGNAGSDSDSEGLERTSPATVPLDQEPSAGISESENESVDKSFQCTQCLKWYSTNVTLKIHKRTHARRGSGGGGGSSRWRRRAHGHYECDCCPQTFSCRENLLQHKAEVHRGAVTVRCEVCRRCFEDEQELQAHDRTHTADERASRCGECGAQFQRWEQLRRHRTCVHPSTTVASLRHPHACHQCGKAFGHAHSLTRHLANHTKAVYRCVVCKVSFARADQLAQHLNSHLANYKRLKN